MKKNGILNSEIAKVLTDLGHTDQITIGDAGLPVPNGVKKINLALALGEPTFIRTLEEVLKDMAIEKVTLAKEIQTDNPNQKEAVLRLIGDVEIEYVSNSEFKKETGQSKAIIRTGEDSPFSNIILQSKVIF